MKAVPTVIVGTGGHGRESAEILQTAFAAGGGYRPVGFLDRRPERLGWTLFGLPVLGDWDWLQQRPGHAVLCAVGSPAVTRRLMATARSLGIPLARAVSPHALISEHAELSDGVIIFPRVVVNCDAHIGEGVSLNVGSSVSHDCRVGAWSILSPGARLAGNVEVGEGCYLGMGCQVIQGRKIGPWSILGAGAVVVHDQPGNVIAVGVPARVRKTRPEGWHLDDSVV